MKKTGQCPRCAGRKVGHLAYVNDQDDYAGTKRALAVALIPRKGILVDTIARDVHVASVEAWVCTECGYFEEYVRSPESVPWEQLEHFTWFQPDED